MTFASDLAAFAVKATRRINTAPGAVMSALAAELVQATPVDTGELRASWQIVVAPAPLAPAAPNDQAGVETIARLQGIAATIVPGDVVRFANVAPYANFVEYGTARIEPRAYMRSTLAKAPMIAATVLAELAAQ